jgi:hypothetical protein
MLLLGCAATAASAAPALAQGLLGGSLPTSSQGALANSGNLTLVPGAAVASTTGTTPNFPGDPHQSTTLVKAGAGTSGATAAVNGGDLAPGVVVNKTVATPAAAHAGANRNVSAIVEAGTQQDNNLQSGLLGRAIVTRNNGAQQTTTFRQVDLNVPKALNNVNPR